MRIVFSRFLGVFLFAYLLCGDASHAQNSFLTLHLAHGVTIDVPRHWWALDEEHNNAIATSRDAALDLSGLGITYTGNVLFAANSRPSSTYASVRVTFDRTEPSSQEELTELLSLTTADVAQFIPDMVNNLSQALRPTGLSVLSVRGLYREDYGDYPALSFRYLRSSSQGADVVVDLIQIFKLDGVVRVNLAYREFEVQLWSAVIERIKKGIVIK